MKLSHIVSASVIALAAAALIAGSASAATTIASSKSNSDNKIGTAAGTTAADCTKAGGTVTTNADGSKTCTLPSATPMGMNKNDLIQKEPASAPATAPTPSPN